MAVWWQQTVCVLRWFIVFGQSRAGLRQHLSGPFHGAAMAEGVVNQSPVNDRFADQIGRTIMGVKKLLSHRASRWSRLSNRLHLYRR